MSYASVNELKAMLAEPLNDTTYAVNLSDRSGATTSDPRYTDAIIQEALNASTDITNGTFRSLTTIPITSHVAKMLDLYHAGSYILGTFERETLALGESSRSQQMLKKYNELFDKVLANPAILGGTVAGMIAYVDGVKIV